MNGPGAVTIKAHAKLNLALAVGPPMAGPGPKAGFHPIASWMACIDVADDLVLTRLADGQPSRYEISWAADAPRLPPPPPASPIDWPVETDLAVRAHRLLETQAGRALPMHMQVSKRIPVGGGLGGGSADGAAALLGINRLFGLGMPVERLAAIAAGLGSDVPFFVDGASVARPAIVTGLGERVERVGRVQGEVVLVFPPFGCPTGQVYNAFDAMKPGPSREHEVRRLAQEAVRSWRVDRCFNDLAEPACVVQPRLGELRRALSADGWPQFQVTGSGSTLFAMRHWWGVSGASGGAAGEDIASMVRRRAGGAVVVRARLC